MNRSNQRKESIFRSPLIGLLAIALNLLAIRTEAASTTVIMNNFSFIPSAVTVNVGDTVLWINETGNHTVTGVGADLFCGTATIPVSCSVTFLEPGIFNYVCLIHESQGMAGTVNVVATNAAVGVAITSPATGAKLPPSGAVVLTATNLTEASLTQVEYFDGEVSLGIATNSPFRVDATLNIGSHTLTARGTQADGATTGSEAVNVTVELEIPNPISQAIRRSTVVIELETVMEGLAAPLGTVALDDPNGRLLVYDQVGMIYVVSGAPALPSPFLNVKSRLVTLNTNYDERGLLGVAAHPNFAQNPLIYTFTSEPNGPAADYPIAPLPGVTNNHQAVIAEWRVDPANPNQVLPDSRRELLRLDKPQANHNGGTVRFGPDGFLYIAVGDGGAADDQGSGHVEGGNGQNRTNLLGKVLRIDVDARTSPNGQYGIPGDNPFISEPGAAREIFAYGFRNPYSFSFDRGTGELWLADVGQNQIEEVDVVVKGGNYGWPVKEGSFFFNSNGSNAGYVTTNSPANPPGNLIDPRAEYDHDEGEAIIGGFVYRGSAVPRLLGMYVTGDFGRGENGRGRLFAVTNNAITELRVGLENRPFGLFLKGFGEDTSGQLYVLGSANSGPTGTTGKLLKIVAPPTNSIAIVAIENTTNGLRISWAGGTPAYTVQKKTSLADSQWVNVQTTPQQEVSVPNDNATGFFRIIDQSGTPP